MSPPERARVERFFAEQLPAVIAAHADLFRTTRGAVAVLVEGAGAWTVTFGATTTPIIDDADPDADLMCVWTVASFTKLLDGVRDLSAIRPAALVGDEKLLERLGALLVPPQQGGLNARLAALAPPKTRAA